MNIRQEAAKMKQCAPEMAASSFETRNRALELISEMLEKQRDEIFEANARDLKAAAENGIAASIVKRLKYDETKMQDSIEGLRELMTLPDPVGKLQLKRELDEGLVLERISVPIGVIGVIFEARPDAMVQVASLCIKSGNCAILKGGKETANTNRVLFGIIRSCAVEAGLPEGCLLQAELHNEIDELLECDEDVDLLIPRGSNSFVRYIMEHTKIPVMGHSSGICHIYVDRAADQEMAVPVIVDAKIQYAAACNAVETVLVDRSIAAEFLPKLANALHEAGVKLRGTQEAAALITESTGLAVDIMEEDAFRTEYNDFVISLKLVDDVKEAVRHINRYGSHHTDSILTKDDEAASYFSWMVDSAGVYRNCSTRFADGFRYGFGAEVGISTGKIHARGPVGLEGLVTYKYVLSGSGQIVGDYTSGKKQFHHRDL
ncbi:MAG: glutamate-5-semialdehyde dehydrogenase [Lachnospiraceae bacterium]|nr:glutamate-5-semialdehyde dehydrogenase [Lachnospiraceae bacterium]